jgi:intron-binding protein aquarius
MPRAKKPKLESTPHAKKAAERPSTADLAVEGGFAQLAKQHWLKSTKRATKSKVNNEVLKEQIWDPLEKEGFLLKSLLTLEGLQVLER